MTTDILTVQMLFFRTYWLQISWQYKCYSLGRADYRYLDSTNVIL